MGDVHAGSNRTIDDTHGDSVTGDVPKYDTSTDAGWNAEPGCTSCALMPDATEMFMGTWHDNTLHSDAVGNNSITFSFTGIVLHTTWHDKHALNTLRIIGTAIWVYCAVVLEGGSGQVTETNIAFNLDGNQLQTYSNDPTNPDATTTFKYNVTVFSQTGLENIEHTLVMTMLPGSWIAFDWAKYT